MIEKVSFHYEADDWRGGALSLNMRHHHFTK